MISFNRHLRNHGPMSDPAIELLDTTECSIAECAAKLHDWIRREAEVG